MSQSAITRFTAPAAALALMVGAASAQDVTINLGYAAAETSTYGVLADKFEGCCQTNSNSSPFGQRR
jgi:hypothetical protein